MQWNVSQWSTYKWSALKCSLVKYLQVQCSVQPLSLYPAARTQRSWRFNISPLATHFTALHCPALQYTALNSSALHCTALHCTAVHCNTLKCPTLHCTSMYCSEMPALKVQGSGQLMFCPYFCGWLTRQSCGNSPSFGQFCQWWSLYESVRSSKVQFN